MENENGDLGKYWRNIVENLPNQTMVLDLNYKILYINHEIYGLSQEKVIGKSIYEYVAEGNAQKTMDAFKEILETGKTINFTTSFVSKSGSTHYFESFISPCSSGNQIIGFIIITADITDRKRTEEELRESEIRFRSIVENSPDFIYIADSKGIVQFINRLYVQHEKEDVLGKSIYDFINPEYHSETMEVIDKVVRTGIPGYIENEAVGPNNTTRFYRIRYVPLKKGTNDLSHIGITTDITEERSATEKLEMNNILLNNTEKIAHIGSFEWDLKKNKIVWSDEMFRIYDITVPENISVNPSMDANKINLEVRSRILQDDLQCFDNAMNSFPKNIIPAMVEYRINKKNGEIRNIRSVAQLIHDESGNPAKLVGTGQDITEKKNLDEERTRLQKMESIGLLAGGIAHDYNNILTSVMGNIQLLQMTEIGNKQSNLLKDIFSAIKRAKDLTNQLLTFSKGGSPIKKPESIRKIIDESVSFAMHGSKSIVKVVQDGEFPHVLIDPGQINQVFNNLLINACQAMPDGGIIRINIREIRQEENAMHELTAKRYLEISVFDNGIGIPIEEQDLIFNPYFTTKSKGSGLGLATCYSIIKNHNGAITFKSQKGKGTTFFIYLPVADGKSGRKKKDELEFNAKGKILVIDDNKAILKTLGLLLKKLDIKVEKAIDGNMGLLKFKDSMEKGDNFDIVVCDLTIPGGMGGKEIAKLLKEIDPKVKIIVSSGYSMDPIMAEYEKYGFDAVLAKPFSFNELKNVLNSLFI